MPSNLEYEIHLIEEIEYKDLYPWSLRELDKNGKENFSPQVPWNWSCVFTASDLHHSRSIDSGREEYEKENKSTIEEIEEIKGNLHSGYCRDGKNMDNITSYSMFGTDRTIEKFDLSISKLDDDDFNERCSVLGFLTYDYEDARLQNVTQSDFLSVNIYLSPKRFNELADLIKTQRADIVMLTLRGVPGFYSEWSPTVLADRIKVLLPAHNREKKVIRPDGCDIDLPTLGKFVNFELNITQRSTQNLKQDFTAIDVNKLFEEDEIPLFVEEEKPDPTVSILSQLQRNEARLQLNENALKKLKTPLWLIFCLLLLLLLSSYF